MRLVSRTIMGHIQMIHEDTETLWQMFIDDPQETYRDELIKRYIPFAKKIAFQQSDVMNTFTMHLDDMIDAAYMGLIQAFDKFDPDNGYSENIGERFTAFARKRVWGEIHSQYWNYSFGTKYVGEKTVMGDYNFDLMKYEYPNIQDKEEADILLERIENNEFHLTVTQIMLLKGFYMENESFDDLALKIGESRQRTKNMMYNGLRKIRLALNIPI